VNSTRIANDVPAGGVKKFYDRITGAVVAVIANGNIPNLSNFEAAILAPGETLGPNGLAFIICTGDVTVNKDYYGLIICDGEITLSANINSDGSSVVSAMSARETPGGGETFGSYLRKGYVESESLSGSVDPEWDYGALVYFSNWRRR
jgi:hypothetical protein